MAVVELSHLVLSAVGLWLLVSGVAIAILLFIHLAESRPDRTRKPTGKQNAGGRSDELHLHAVPGEYRNGSGT